MSSSLTAAALSGKSLLITGVSGFLGKVILEKLLRSVPDIKQIYLVIRRNQQYHSAQERFEKEIAGSSIFNRLKQDPTVNFTELCDSKLRFITGEITQDYFGLEASQFHQLAHQVDVIINSAASVDFREPMDSALRINTLSLYNLIKLTWIKPSPVIQVSTCYVNGFHKGLITEDVRGAAKITLQQKRGYFDVEPLIQQLNQEIEEIYNQNLQAEEQTRRMVRLGVLAAKRSGWNDSYTMTKWMGEQVLLKELQGQALTIVRPAIIESTLQGPVPGWIEGVKVADAIILAYAREKISIFPGNKHGIIDIIPADLVANSVILSAAEALYKTPAHRIYQCSSSHCNPVAIKDVIEYVQSAAHERHHHYENLFVRKPQKPFVMMPSLLFNSIIHSSYHLVKTRNRIAQNFGTASAHKLQRNLETAIQLSSIFSFYTQPKYTFSNQKLCAMAGNAGRKDNAEFPVDATMLDWRHYLSKVHIAGLNEYALKPKDSTVKQSDREKQAEVV